MIVEFIVSIVILLVSLLAFILPIKIYYIIGLFTLIFMGLILKSYYSKEYIKRQLLWSYILLFVVGIFFMFIKPPLLQALLLVEGFLVIRTILITIYNKEQVEVEINDIEEPEISNRRDVQSYVDKDLNSRTNTLIELMVDSFNENLIKATYESNQSNEKSIEDIKTQLSDSIRTKITSELEDIMKGNSTNNMEMKDLIEKKLDEFNDNLYNVVSSSTENKNQDEELHNLIKASIDKSLNQIKNDSENKDVSLLANEVAKILQKENIDTTVTKHIRNEEIREWFVYALKYAEEEINIISPWIGFWVIQSEFIELIKNALKRGVTIKIVYGIEDNYKSSKRDDKSEKYAEMLQKSCRKYKDLLLMKKGNTHYKLLICDEKYYIAGSFNFLSFKGDYSQENTRDEGADYSESKKQIKFKRELYFDF